MFSLSTDQCKNCFLCNKSIPPGSYLSSGIEENVHSLCELLDLPEFGSESQKLAKITYCRPCKKKVFNIRDMLEELERLENMVMYEKYQLELQFKESTRNFQRQTDEDEHTYEPDPSHTEQLKSQLISELQANSVASMLKKIRKNQVGRNRRKSFRIMKNVEIPGPTPRVLDPVVLEILPNNIPDTDVTDFQMAEDLNEVNIVNSENCWAVDVTENVTIKCDPLMPRSCDTADSEGQNYSFYGDEVKSVPTILGETIVDCQAPNEFNSIPSTSVASSNKTFLCGHCDEKFTCMENLDTHGQTHHSLEQRTMSVQQIRRKYINNKKKISKKSNSVENPKRFCCHLCSKQFRTAFNLKSHLERHSGRTPLPYKCKICFLRFISWQVMRNHMAETHNFSGTG